MIRAGTRLGGGGGRDVRRFSPGEDCVWLPILLHLCAAAALTGTCAVAFRALTFSSWAGALFGLCLYAGSLALTFVGERSDDA